MRAIKTILVTGGSGFIGWNFCNLILQNTNYNIINIDDLTYASKDKVFYIHNQKQYQFYKKNICDPQAILDIFDKHKIDAVVHFAAETHVDNSIQQSDQFVKTNVLGTHNLIQICKEQMQQKKLNKDFVFIHISTDEVFGHLEKQDPAFTEETKYNPRNPYSASKAAADHLVRSFISTYEFPALILNCCNNFGPFQHKEKLIPKIIDNIIQQKPIPIYGKGEQIREWIYAEDFGRAILQVLQYGLVGQSYNVGSGQEFQNIDLAHLICERMDQQLKRKQSSKQLITFVQDRPGHDFRYAMNSGKIKKDLGWQSQTSVEEGLDKTIEYYLSQKQNIKTASI
jgi:dTDP-glucose 4,6-dehydratase